MTRLIVPVVGTWQPETDVSVEAGGGVPWHLSGSRFMRFCASRRAARVPARGEGDGGAFWSGDLEGTLLDLLRDRSADAWYRGGAEIASYLRKLLASTLLKDKPPQICVVAHSHGGQAAACGVGALLRGMCPRLELVTVDTPVRAWLGADDMEPAYRRAAENVPTWVHLYSDFGWSSRFGRLGNRLGPRRNKFADVNLHVKGGHSGCLRDPRYIPQWGEVFDVLDARA